MITAWILYAIVVGAILGVGALALLRGDVFHAPLPLFTHQLLLRLETHRTFAFHLRPKRSFERLGLSGCLLVFTSAQQRQQTDCR